MLEQVGVTQTEALTSPGSESSFLLGPSPPGIESPPQKNQPPGCMSLRAHSRVQKPQWNHSYSGYSSFPRLWLLLPTWLPDCVCRVQGEMGGRDWGERKGKGGKGTWRESEEEIMDKSPGWPCRIL